MKPKILTIFTRTPLHVGAGSSVGAIDQPVQRERHTAFPIIPGSSIKGVVADAWRDELIHDEKKKLVRPGKDDETREITWLFGSEDSNAAASGALRFSEARLLAFPVRSTKGGFAWITSPLALSRAKRDGLIPDNIALTEPAENAACFQKGKLGLNDGRAVFEEYAFEHAGEVPTSVSEAIANLLDDPVWHEAGERLVIISNGMMSFFAQAACEVAQHVRIDSKTGTAVPGALFNQENVPSDSLFYSIVHCAAISGKSEDQAAEALARKLADKCHTLQFGGDASTGLGYCSVTIR